MKNFSNIASAITESKHYTLFTVGDSITHGGRASSDDTTYTAVLATLLASRYPERTVKRYDGIMFDTPDAGDPGAARVISTIRNNEAHFFRAVAHVPDSGASAGALLLRTASGESEANWALN